MVKMFWGCVAGMLAALLGSGGTLADSLPLKVVTTVAPIADMVSRVGGEAVALYAAIPAGRNSHTFEPAPATAKQLAAADLIIANGLQLELPLLRLAQRVKRPEVYIARLGDRTVPPARWRYDEAFPATGGAPNPHVWLDASLAVRYVEAIRDVLVEAAPQYQSTFITNAHNYLALLQRLDRVIKRCMGTIPAPARKLVTYHDAFAYFGPRYGLQVIGAVHGPALAQPGPRDVARLIDQLRARKVAVVFGSVMFPHHLLAQIARESGARFVSGLADDMLPGRPGDANHSYIGMMESNVGIITAALGGDERCLEALR